MRLEMLNVFAFAPLWDTFSWQLLHMAYFLSLHNENTFLMKHKGANP